MRTILVVEDEPQIAALVRDYLEHAGFAVLLAADGERGLALARSRRPDAIVLDLGLPRLDGLDVVRALRRDSDVPIVVLTARGDETDRVAGLELGADDYVVKPFSPRELVARVRAILRRAETTARPVERLVVGDLEVDVVRRRVTTGGRIVALTPTEFELLATLAREPGRVFTRGQLLDAVRGFSLETYERAIDGHVKNLRRKIEPDPGAPRYVRTVHGVGYALAEPEREPVPEPRPGS
jgi:DNA-binding response OmpR family regulator